MAVNRDKPDRWKEDIAKSVDMCNDWFMRFTPEAYRTTRVPTTKDNAFIACDKDTPRFLCRPLKNRRERLKTIEARIRSRYLKARKAVPMAQVAGRARPDSLACR